MNELLFVNDHNKASQVFLKILIDDIKSRQIVSNLYLSIFCFSNMEVLISLICSIKTVGLNHVNTLPHNCIDLKVRPEHDY